MGENLIHYLSQFITDERFKLFQRILNARTDYFSVVLEDIYQSQNASAVLRSCDCFGIQDVHIIENRNSYRVNPDVSLGASKWLRLIKYNNQDFNTIQAIDSLKKDGYRIVATSPHSNAISLEDFDIHAGKSAFLFGTELTGLSEEAMNHADEYVTIPMYGFSESFNISVSVALVLHTVVYKLKNSDIHWQLSPAEKEEILYSWLKSSIKKVEHIEKYYLDK